MNMSETEGAPSATLSDWFRLMKPGVLALLQVTAMCAILIHDLIEWNAAGRTGFDFAATLRIMAVVFVGGFLTAGGAHPIAVPMVNALLARAQGEEPVAAYAGLP